jgi:hypothetical protein
MATHGKDIDKYEAKVRLYLRFIAENNIKAEENNQQPNKPGKIEEASANIEIKR